MLQAYSFVLFASVYTICGICELLWQDISESWPIRDLMDHSVHLETETRVEAYG